MLSVDSNKLPTVTANTYSLRAAADRPYVVLSDANGKPIAELFVLSSVHTLDGRDDTLEVGAWHVAENKDEVTLELSATSSVWQRKTYRFRCYPEFFRYEITLDGQSHIAEALYFGGYSSAHIRWGTGFFWSGQHFEQGFNPEPTVDETYTFPASSGSVIDLYGVPLPGKWGSFYTPPPFCFAFQAEDRWIAAGVEGQPGQNHYSDYQYRGQRGAFCLALNYEGYTRVDGTYTMPAIGFYFADDPYDAMAIHARESRSHVIHTRQPYDWWYEPIYCGWGSQVHLAVQQKGRAPDYARQEHYEGFMRALEVEHISPGVAVIDDKWQATYGDNQVDTDKWPDLRGFMDAQHDRGRRVLLWLKAWDPEGLPLEECVGNAAGVRVSADPTNPAYERRLREAIRRMLSPDGYNADGFKIDFTARIPCSPGLSLYENVWGLELMRRYLGIVYSEAKQVKPDALIMTQTPHPYLADVTDMIRLNDINIHVEVNRAMIHRARIAALACPDALIDTDNWPITNRQVWQDYTRLQPTLGIPSLYYATHISETGEALEAEDYALVRETWAVYRAKLAAISS